MRCKHVADIMRAVRKETGNRAPSGVRVVDPISLDCQTPSLIERVLVVGSVLAGRLHRLDEERAWILGTSEKHTSMPVYIGLDMIVEAAEVRQNQSKRLAPEIRRIGVLEGDRWD